MNMEATYTALKDFVEAALAETAGSVPDTRLRVEMADGPMGEEWTGIYMSKLPTNPTRQKDIAGGGKLAFTYQLVSKQELDHSEGGAIAFSTYLEKLTSSLQQRFKSGLRPALPDGLTMLGVEAVQQSTLNFADTTYSGYVLDLRFTLHTRSF